MKALPIAATKGVLYTTVDRADNKQYRELYTTPAPSPPPRRDSLCRAAPC
jgi:hypothetical protein